MKLPIVAALMLCSAAAQASECVILLHGLARTASSMETLKTTLEQEGYRVVNIDYPSRTMEIPELAELAVDDGITQCSRQKAAPVNFVTHSLGGILVRQYFSNRSSSDINRVVMLGPPNKGSEVVDNLKNAPGYKLLNGPAGMQLGTDKDSIPSQLGPVAFELGVIAGTQSINLILSSFLPNPDDGKVSVENTKVAGMCSFVSLPATHPFLMKNEQVISEAVSFLKTGRFKNEQALNNQCGP